MNFFSYISAGGKKPPGSTLASCKGLHQGVGDGLEGLEVRII